ncbi:hypothetical protein CN582_01115 [Bacillus wiedmannii]|uniref:flavodoxin family protein n=1 Tax=Bacillus wiedmannii TaxID=1890302 RepID=UPI000BF77295|nr:NAD(P)H-dependent oxidoreductase [Bacillus wiedmannii]PEP21571.1 hypothetical protein CN580_20510 [Bacillus wiedmannii]PEQ00475.1 hypothetical protein CN582_01115 [Bacillus wiedmannii]PFY70238.1 hypothetical protein COL61_20350 [Bacillus wiedmannii]PHF06715.1 hypothetical protein COF74_20100 [Bacillus wiedmannii]PHF94469.1 hypothetical protein COI45_13915 [Bacillus wiedmannii]
MNIFVYSGSPRDEASSSYKYCKKYVDAIKKIYSANIEINFYSPNNLSFMKSDGNENIFINGEDPLDKIDGFSEVKNQLLQADLIIMASPVMAQAVSTDMKMFIERISHFAHTFSLMGKLGCIVTSSYSNGNEIVEAYLKKTLDYMGVATVATKRIRRIENEQMDEELILDEARSILPYLLKKKIPKIEPDQCKVFEKMRELYVLYQKNPRYSYEYNQYKKNGFINSKSFQEVFTSFFLN